MPRRRNKSVRRTRATYLCGTPEGCSHTKPTLTRVTLESQDQNKNYRHLVVREIATVAHSLQRGVTFEGILNFVLLSAEAFFFYFSSFAKDNAPPFNGETAKKNAE